MLVELLKATEVVVGLVVLAFSFLSGLVVYIDRRQRKRADEAVTQVKIDHKSSSEKIDGLVIRVAKLEGEVRTGLDDVDTRVQSLEKSMETVARQSDIVAMSGEIGGFKEAIRGTGKQVSMLYEAALSREKGGN